MDRGAWYATVHGVAKSRTRLSDFTYLLNGICSRDLFPHLVTRNLKTDVSTFWNSLMNNYKISWNNCKRYNFRCIWNMFIKNCYITFKNGRDLISTIIYSKYTCNFFFFLAVQHGLWDHGLNLGPRQWEHRVLTTGPPGNSSTNSFPSVWNFISFSLWAHVSVPL